MLTQSSSSKKTAKAKFEILRFSLKGIIISCVKAKKNVNERISWLKIYYRGECTKSNGRAYGCG